MSCGTLDPILVMQKVPVYHRKTDGQTLILAHIARRKETGGKQDLTFSLSEKITITELTQKIIMK